ncbi:MAG: ATP-dependent DNA helicase RecG [Clostridia bacterium]|nr:ATP-dependent DNA helicase RecG [Clostridia bacterium]
MMDLFQMPISNISGVSNARLTYFQKLGIFSVGDMLYFFPKSYENRMNQKCVANLSDEETATVTVRILDVSSRRVRQNLTLISAMAEDETGTLKITFFNQKYLINQLKVGQEITVFGKVSRRIGYFEMTNPAIQKAVARGDFSENYIPKYPLTKGLTQGVMQKVAHGCLLVAKEHLQETLSFDIRKKYHLCELLYALENIHFPTGEEELASAKKRLVFEELFYLMLGLGKLKLKQKKAAGPKLVNYKIAEEFAKQLPFPLTDAQKRVTREICYDFKQGYQMNRLVQGDVGSGKTMVAAMAMLICAQSGYQAVLMAPTEILARQHFEGLKPYFDAFGVSVELLVSSMKKKEKTAVQNGLHTGEISLVIGTHALIYDTVQFQKLGLVITDEQHRFGVKARAELTKKGENPHCLVMTATPIPRTLALIIYGDLDVSVIDELPKGRIPVVTRIASETQRELVYSFVSKELAKKNQAFVVCPLIEESEALDAENAIRVQEELQTRYLKEYRIGLLHGKMKADEKDAVMNQFASGEYDVLVSTTVVEVGVNVPNATVMVIENAERFGLASLHQLRGRVGRGQKKSYCFLNLADVKAKKRLEIMEKTTDGFQISEFDLKHRGPGEFFGTRQHGLPSMRLSNLTYSMETVRLAKEAAETVLSEDCDLVLPKNKKIRTSVEKMFSENEFVSQL